MRGPYCMGPHCGLSPVKLRNMFDGSRRLMSTDLLLSVTVWEPQGSPPPSSLTTWEDVSCSRGAWPCSESLDSPPQASANSPARQGVKVPFLRVEHLVFHPSQSKANGQHGESEDGEACDPKHSSPGVKPAHRGRKGVSALRAPQGTFNPFSRINPEWDRESDRTQERFPDVLIHE